MCDVEKNEGAANQLQTIKLGSMTMSYPNNEIATALAKAQGAIMNAKKTADNPWYNRKYAALDEVWDSARQPLSENGLAFTQWPSVAPTGEIVKWYDKDSRPKEAPGALVTVTSLLEHSSGQFKVSEYTMPSIFDVQKIGSAITYARRYAMMAILGIAPEDDDGNEASMQGAPGGNNQPQQQQKKPQQVQKPTQQASTQTKPQQQTQGPAQPPVKNQAPAQAPTTQSTQSAQTEAEKAKSETERRVAEERAKMQTPATQDQAPVQTTQTAQNQATTADQNEAWQGIPCQTCGTKIYGNLKNGKPKALYSKQKLGGCYCDPCGIAESKRQEEEAKAKLLPQQQAPQTQQAA
jgi:hypothetical protein